LLYIFRLPVFRFLGGFSCVCLFVSSLFLSGFVSIYDQVLIFSYPFARPGLISLSMLPRRFLEGKDGLVSE